jgi:hypothetical protein
LLFIPGIGFLLFLNGLLSFICGLQSLINNFQLRFYNLLPQCLGLLGSPELFHHLLELWVDFAPEFKLPGHFLDPRHLSLKFLDQLNSLINIHIIRLITQLLLGGFFCSRIYQIIFQVLQIVFYFLDLVACSCRVVLRAKGFDGVLDAVVQ